MDAVIYFVCGHLKNKLQFRHTEVPKMAIKCKHVSFDKFKDFWITLTVMQLLLPEEEEIKFDILPTTKRAFGLLV